MINSIPSISQALGYIHKIANSNPHDTCVEIDGNLENPFYKAIADLGAWLDKLAHLPVEPIQDLNLQHIARIYQTRKLAGKTGEDFKDSVYKLLKDKEFIPADEFNIANLFALEFLAEENKNLTGTSNPILELIKFKFARTAPKTSIGFNLDQDKAEILDQSLEVIRREIDGYTNNEKQNYWPLEYALEALSSTGQEQDIWRLLKIAERFDTKEELKYCKEIDRDYQQKYIKLPLQALATVTKIAQRYLGDQNIFRMVDSKAIQAAQKTVQRLEAKILATLMNEAVDDKILTLAANLVRDFNLTKIPSTLFAIAAQPIKSFSAHRNIDAVRGLGFVCTEQNFNYVSNQFLNLAKNWLVTGENLESHNHLKPTIYKTLGKIGNYDALELLQQYSKQYDYSINNDLIYALKDIGEPALNELKTILLKHPIKHYERGFINEKLIEPITETLAYIGSEEAIKMFAEIYQELQKYRYGYLASSAFPLIKSEAGVKMLEKLFDEYVAKVQPYNKLDLLTLAENIAKAAGNFNEPRPPIFNKVRNFLKEVFDQSDRKDSYKIGRIIHALGHLGNAEDLKTIIEFGDQTTCGNIPDSILEVNDQSLFNPIAKRLQNTAGSGSMHRLAAALAAQVSKDSVTILKQELQRRDPYDQLCIASGIASSLAKHFVVA